jgi:type IV pilus assembly protein PilO
MNTHVRKSIFTVALIAIPVAAWFMVFAPRNVAIQAAVEDIQARQARLDQLSLVIADVPDLEAALIEGERLIARVETRLPRRKHVEGILEQIWQIARRQDMNVRSVKTRSPERSSAYMELPLEVDMAGSFEGFYRFLLELESLPRVTRMSDLTLKKVSAQPGHDPWPPGSVSARFVLRIYFADAMPTGAIHAEVSR